MDTVLAYLAKNKEWIFSGIGVLILSTISAVVWQFLVRQRSSVPTALTLRGAQTETQTGAFVIAMTDGETHEIFYPRTFIRPPFLKIKCVDGKIGLRVKEQRANGFLIETYIKGSAYGSSDGITIAWEAQGRLE